jgi:hydrogenase maturation protease
MTETVVLGLGNFVHADDGVGVHAIHRLQRDPRLPLDVVLLDGGTQGLALLPHISGVRRLLVIDAIDVGEPSGTLLRFEGKALRGLPGKSSVHQLGFADLMVALQLLGEPPAEIVVLGVQPMSTEWSAELTEPVANALGPLVDTVIAQLKSWKGMQGMSASSIGRIVEERSENNSRVGTVEFDGKRRTVYLNLVPEARVGDCVRFRAGFATEMAPPCESGSESGMPVVPPTAEIIHAYKVLSELDPQQLRKLLPLAVDQQFDAGQIIFRSEEKSRFLHLIVSGEVILEEDTGDQVIPVYTLRDGDAMGWSALTADAVTHFQARAVTPVSTVAFPSVELRAACDQDPAMGYALMKRLLELVTERLDATRMKLAQRG